MKYLALEKELQKGEIPSMRSLLEQEARRVYELYLQGIIRECYFTKEEHKAVIILECNNKNEAHEVLETLPLVKEKVIDFQILTLMPYTGLDRIINHNI